MRGICNVANPESAGFFVTVFLIHLALFKQIAKNYEEEE
jgi:hypothetical protein